MMTERTAMIEVWSETTKGETYRVEYSVDRGDVLSCTCKSFTYCKSFPRSCKHMREIARRFHEAGELQRVMTADGRTQHRPVLRTTPRPSTPVASSITADDLYR